MLQVSAASFGILRSEARELHCNGFVTSQTHCLEALPLRLRTRAHPKPRPFALQAHFRPEGPRSSRDAGGLSPLVSPGRCNLSISGSPKDALGPKTSRAKNALITKPWVRPWVRAKTP